MPAEIIVKGVAEVRVMPDLARLRLDVDGEGATRDSAYAAATESAAAIDVVLDASAGLVRAVTSTALVVQPRTRWRKGERVRTGWRAARSTTVEVTAVDELSGFVAQVVNAGASLHGPTWEVGPEHAAHAQARRAAAQDAHARAQEYADGLGLVLGEVAWVSEPGLRRGAFDGDDWAGGDQVVALSLAGGDERDAPMDLAPAELTISATVEVAFAFRAAG